MQIIINVENVIFGNNVVDARLCIVTYINMSKIQTCSVQNQLFRNEFFMSRPSVVMKRIRDSKLKF